MNGINVVYNESCIDTISRLVDKSISCVVTSPPYWQKRDYGSDEQWGLESTPEKYLEHLWMMMGSRQKNDGIWRILRDDGTVWINLGDSFANASIKNVDKSKILQKDKCQLLLPHRFAIGCMEMGWIIRNDINWVKTQVQPESVSDRFSVKKEYVFFMTKTEEYFFDLNAIREKHKDVSILSASRGRRGKGKQNQENVAFNRELKPFENLNKLGKNPGDVSSFWDEHCDLSLEEYLDICEDFYLSQGDNWVLKTSGRNSKFHYATFSQRLIQKPIRAGCPQFICNSCGKPRVPLYGSEENSFIAKFIGYSDCSCNAGFRPGIVYDPFTGSGTTAMVSITNNRWFIGSEISKKYSDYINQQVGFFLNKEDGTLSIPT